VQSSVATLQQQTLFGDPGQAFILYV